MNSKIIIIALLLAFPSLIFSQITYSGKVEMGYLKFLSTTIVVDPGDNWKGYYLNKKQNGIVVNSINGISLADKKIFLGVGLGYLNFEGVDGVSSFLDFEYLPFKKKITPLINIKVGYTHIWNQYEGGSGTLLGDFGIGINWKMSEKYALYFRSGLYVTQQSALVPFCMGLRF